MTEPLVRFSDLCDLLTTAGCEVGVELRGDEHAVVVTDGGRRVLRAPVERDFDRTATLLVLSGALRQRWGARDSEHDGWVVRGSWPELEALASEVAG
jgi:hypothetical protein